MEPETQDVPTRPSDIDDGIHRVLVDSSPQGAQVMMGALPLGRTPLQVELKDLGQAVRLTLEMDGYVPRQVTLSGAQTKVGVPLEPAMTGPDDR
ncbi:MAG: PEGA domain-containing protein [Deltaproteobacteria bacterium]|nr:MAG: PEGA domain-containing protein [Deltaproteobacteria bacterium]